MGIRVIRLNASGTIVDAQSHPRTAFVAAAKNSSNLLDLCITRTWKFGSSGRISNLWDVEH
jgi:hypothetical protein